MMYVSTRGQGGEVTASQAILQGIASDGGLYLPKSIPLIDDAEWRQLCRMNYRQTALWVLSRFLTDYTPAQLEQCVAGAYNTQNFSGGIAPVVTLNNGVSMLELWHGPTSAFKDMALQLMPRLFVTAMDIRQDKRRAVVLVATSGDTGKAALDGFAGLPGTQVAVVYPADGVSAVQRRQMTTQQGDNVAVAAVDGNFDDAQTAVKRVFSDKVFNEELAQKNVFLSSANSINWGRLAPQIVYYIHACAEMQRQGLLEPEQQADICVPTGNFGNILAAYYAKRMGAPIGRLLCASNANNVLTDFIQTGQYDSNRAFYKTTSPSMDILISSNLERLLWLLSDGDGSYVASLMAQLAQTGRYEVSDVVRQKLADSFAAGWCDDDATRGEINEVWHRQHYLLDPHTTVAFHVARQLGDCAPLLVVSTASPFKFAPDVLRALGADVPNDEMQAIDALTALTGLSVPSGFKDLDKLPERFTTVLKKDGLEAWLRSGIL